MVKFREIFETKDKTKMRNPPQNPERIDSHSQEVESSSSRTNIREQARAERENLSSTIITQSQLIQQRIDEFNENLNEDREKLRTASVQNIRYETHVLTSRPQPSDEIGRINNVKAETARRINAYTSAQTEGWHKIDYKSVGGEEHERMIGLGDILMDPDIKLIKIKKRNGTEFTAERGVSKTGRVSFLYAEDVPSLNKKKGDYVATFTGDQFKIIDTADNKETIPSENPAELTRYIEKLNSEEAQRKENQRESQASLEYSHDNIHHILETIGIAETTDNLTNKQVIEWFQERTHIQIIEIRREVHPSNLRRLFKETGLDNYSQKEELINEIRRQVNDLDENHDMLSAFGEKETLIDGMIRVAAVESGFRPFNWSRTNCMGFFQFTKANTENLKINPLNPKEAVEGLLKLWEGNYKSGAKTPELLFAAHYRGTGKMEDERGTEYADKIASINPDEFRDQNDETQLNRRMSAVAPTSAPYEINPETGATLCSRTAANNLKNLGVENPPRGNANEVAFRLQNNPEAIGGSKEQIISRLNSLIEQGKEIIAVDVFVKGASAAGRVHGHRAVAYRAPNGNWRILDPYRNRNRHGVNFENYNGIIEFVVPYYRTQSGTVGTV